MTIGLLLLALLMAAILWWLFRQSVGAQPWIARPAAHDVYPALLARPPAKTALWVFLAVATSLFALFISAYAMRIGYPDWTPLPQPRLLTVNSALLVLASLALQWTVVAARRGDAERVRMGLAAGGVLTFAFLAGQALVWKQLADGGYFFTSSAATGFFYLLTAVHGLHVVGGLVAWGRNALRAVRGWQVEKLRLGIELTAMYWHFLLAVWLVLFAVLVLPMLGLSICSSTPL